METLIKEIDELLREKNNAIDTLDWRVKYLEKEVARLNEENDEKDREIIELRKEIAELNIDIEKYKENEVNGI